MNTLTLAIELSEKLYKAHIKVLKYFLENPIFEGSYRELSKMLYGKSNQQSNARRLVNELANMGVLMVEINNDCPSRDQNRTYIQLNPNWLQAL